MKKRRDCIRFDLLSDYDTDQKAKIPDYDLGSSNVFCCIPETCNQQTRHKKRKDI